MRPDDPDPAAVRVLVERIFRGSVQTGVERVMEGVSTYVYRVHRGGETFYLRILPEEGDSFAPEAWVHATLRARGVLVPEVVYCEHYDETVGRSVMVTTEIKGGPVGRRPADEETHRIVVEAGRQLGAINRVPVAGFGWVKRDRSEVTALEAEHTTYRAFVAEHLDADLAALEAHVLTREEVAAIRAVIEGHRDWLAGEEGRLAHGDFDVTHIFEHEGRYTGIIDFGEIRGTDRWYDLGHFRMHDGETLPTLMLDCLVEGYASMTPLPADSFERICFASLLIATRALGRRIQKDPRGVRRHQGLMSIPRDLAVLYH